MTGGLLEITTSGYTDDFLIKNPEITFFKAVYKKYVNFSIETTEIPFDITFGSETTLIIPPYGDLIHKMILKIDLPLVNIRDIDFIEETSEYFLIKQTKITNQKNIITVLKDKYESLKKYGDIIIGAYKIILTALKPKIINLAFIKTQILQYRSKNNQIYVDSKKKVDHSIISKTDIISKVLDIQDTSVSTKTLLTDVNNSAFDELKKQLLYFFNKYQENKTKLEEIESPNIEFAWMKHLGHFIMNNIELEIDGRIIDRYSSGFYHIWQNLKVNENIFPIYNKLTGNVESMFSFNTTEKPVYTLFIPLIFYMCEDVGNSLPIVSLRYSDVQIRFKMDAIKNCCFLEDWKYEFNKISFRKIELSKFVIKTYESTKITTIDDKVYIPSTITLNTNTNNLEIKDVLIYKEDLIILFPNLLDADYNYILETYGSIKDNNIASMNETEWITFRQTYLEDENVNQILKDIHFYLNKNDVLNSIEVSKVSLLIDYIYIDIHEKKKYAVSNLEYLMTQVQENTFNITQGTFINNSLSFNRMIKEMFWTTQPTSYLDNTNGFQEIFPYNYVSEVIKSQILLENEELMTNNFQKEFFNTLNIFKYHTNSKIENVYLYSFALDPESYQPTGICNFSGYKDKILQLTFNSDTISRLGEIKINVYSKCYNILKIHRGKAEVLFA
jgi:hypothetical protein